jgi:PfpI family intracellular protease
VSRIAVIITDMFEDSEYSEPAAAFKKAGHQLVHIGLKAGQTVTGKKQATPVEIDKAVKDVSAEEFDALLIPGGYSPDKLRVDEDAVRFAKQFVESGKPVFAICHAPQLLITADAIRPQDHRMEIGHPGYQKRRGRVYRFRSSCRRQPGIEPEPCRSSGIYRSKPEKTITQEISQGGG